MDLIITILPVVTKDLPISLRFTPYNFLSRCKFSTLTTRQPMVEFYLLTFPRFPLRKKEHKSYFGKNRTHDFRTSRCAAYLLDHSGDVHQTRPVYSSDSQQLLLSRPSVSGTLKIHKKNNYSGIIYTVSRTKQFFFLIGISCLYFFQYVTAGVFVFLSQLCTVSST